MSEHTTPAQRAQQLLDLVKAGQTAFFKVGDDWDIIGPATAVEVGKPVTATRRDGTTVQVTPTRIMSERTVQGVATRTAKFLPVDTAVASERPVFPVADRTATRIGAALGQTTPVTGRCHYCGLPLNRNGHCDECV